MLIVICGVAGWILSLIGLVGLLVESFEQEDDAWIKRVKTLS